MTLEEAFPNGIVLFEEDDHMDTLGTCGTCPACRARQAPVTGLAARMERAEREEMGFYADDDREPYSTDPFYMDMDG